MLSTWRVEVPSFVGRVTLVRSVVEALPTYTMQTPLLPKYVCMDLECMNRDFVWGMRDNGRTRHTTTWDQFCLSRKNGGLGFRNLHDFNKALLMKLDWGLMSNNEALWVNVIHSKYKCGNNVLPDLGYMLIALMFGGGFH